MPCAWRINEFIVVMLWWNVCANVEDLCTIFYIVCRWLTYRLKRLSDSWILRGGRTSWTWTSKDKMLVHCSLQFWIYLFSSSLGIQVFRVSASKIRISGIRAGMLSIETIFWSMMQFQRRFHNLYNNPCFSTNPWHLYTQHSHIQQTLNRFHGLHRMFQRLYHILSERYFLQLKWVFHGISFCFLVCEICLFEVTHVCTQCGRTYKHFKQVLQTPYNVSEALP